MSEPLIVLVCGSREWTDEKAIWDVVSNLRYLEVPRDFIIINGACRGADQLASKVATMMGLTFWEFPAEWKRGKRAGPERNARMLSYGPHLVLAFHDALSSSKGTKDMIRQALKAHVPVQLYKHGHITTTVLQCSRLTEADL